MKQKIVGIIIIIVHSLGSVVQLVTRQPHRTGI